MAEPSTDPQSNNAPPDRRSLLFGGVMAGAAIAGAAAAQPGGVGNPRPSGDRTQTPTSPLVDETAGPIRPGRGSQLQGKVAVVTGAARGIGRAIAVELAAKGRTSSSWTSRVRSARRPTPNPPGRKTFRRRCNW